MKKAVLLMVLILMAIIIFSSSPASAKISIHVSPSPPVKVGAGDNIVIDWYFNRTIVEENDYYIIIHELNMPEREYLNRRVPIPQGQEEIDEHMTWPISEDVPHGKYIAMVRYKLNKAQEEFWVGPTVDLTINKFYDYDQNKVQDPGEQGLAGWTFTVEYIDNPDVEPVLMTTGSDGTDTHYKLAAGKYRITETGEGKGKCWRSSTPKTKIIELEEGKKRIVNFGNYEVGTLEIIKFNDTDGDGIRDPAKEEGLSNWGFSVTFPNETSTDVETGEDGTYNLSNVPAGKYTIIEKITEEREKEGWIVTTPSTQVKVLKPCSTEKAEFGNHYRPPYGNLSIFKFNDTNNNSIRDPGEGGLEGWEFEIKQDGRLVDTCVTDPNGYCVRSLLVGTYTITERLKSGWEATTMNPVVRDVKAEETTNVEFGNHYPLHGNLSIFKFSDLNNNSIRDPEEGGLEGWEFEIMQDDSLVDTCVTDPKGYCVRSLLVGTYTITEQPKPFWVNTTPRSIVREVKAEETTNVEFGNYPVGTLSIFKFDDLNNNSIRDLGEEGLEGWEFEIMQDGRLVDTCVTDPNGYCVRELLEGRYKITEQQSRCWVSTTPASREIAVRAGQTTEVEFGNYAIGNLTIQKFYDANRNKVQEYGEDGLPNWTFTVTFPDGSSKRITTDANGTYTLINVPIGRYTITEEAMTCRWMNSTLTTQYVEVTACQETIASFGNYIVDCSIPPGCPWFNEDENLNVSKSVVPCECNITPIREGESTSKEVEPEVSVYLRVCVDKRLIKDGIAVENITVVETLHNHFTVIGDSFSEQPRAIKRNPDGTTTITWDIPSLCCEEWNVSFNVTVAFALPIDVTDTSERITSKVIYEDPIETGRRELSIPEGTLKFSFIAPIPPICYVLGGLLVLSISIEITLKLKRRKKEKSKEKEKE